MADRPTDAEIAILEDLLQEARVIEGSIGKSTGGAPILKSSSDLQRFVSRAVAWIVRVFGIRHRYSQAVEEVSARARMGGSTDRARAFRVMYGTLGAATADIEAGVLISQAEQITADLFADELEIAQFLLPESHGAATVLAGAVLELALLRMCESRDIPVLEKSTIGKLNDLLYKADPPAYERSMQKQITAWADLQNDAAHGRWENIEPGQTRLMIDGVRAFVG